MPMLSRKAASGQCFRIDCPLVWMQPRHAITGPIFFFNPFGIRTRIACVHSQVSPHYRTVVTDSIGSLPSLTVSYSPTQLSLLMMCAQDLFNVEVSIVTFFLV